MKQYGDITVFVAHPDDEILFLWPFLQAAKRIVCCVSDERNPERQWCARRGQALTEVGALLGAEVVNLGGNSEFYRLSTRDETLKQFAAKAAATLTGTVATHNPWGEYGHIDHILCHHIAHVSGRPLMTTDIAQEVNWLPLKRRAPGEFLSNAEIDMDLFSQCKAIYDRYGCWTWSQPVVEQCGVYVC